MPDTSRYLITTADERTWKFDRPVVFLGDWCRVYDRKHIWENMDAIVANPYGLGKDQKDVNHSKARSIEEDIFPDLCAVLNRYHGNQFSCRFWRIVLGHWFRRYIDVILNRVSTLEACMSNHRLSGTSVLRNDCYTLATQDSYSAIWAFDDDRWNSELYRRLLDVLDKPDIPVDFIDSNEPTGFRWNATAVKKPLVHRVLKWFYSQLGRLCAFFVKKNDAFILNTYLSRKQEFKLQLEMKQFPQLWISKSKIHVGVENRNTRKKLTGEISRSSEKNINSIARSMIFKLLPLCYLESFDSNLDLVNKLPWPDKPEFIFTSNNFDTDEMFKLWAATKAESGCKYIVGQHGNNYGTYRYMNPSVEELTSDKFITWGWCDQLPQHTPAFMLKQSRYRNRRSNPVGNLLLIEDIMYQRLDTWDRASEYEYYFSQQIEFVDNLSATQKNNLIVRVHPMFKSFKSHELLRWGDYDKGLFVDTGVESIQDLVSKSRIVVHGYDSTGILETLSANIPTLAFWQNNLDHLRDSAKPYYQRLIDAGIVHLSAKSAAEKVTEIWDDVRGWWEDKPVQDARIAFCDQYARTSNRPVHDLKIILQ